MQPGSFKELVGMGIDFITLLVPVLFALTFAYMAWGVIKGWVINGGEKGVEEGKNVAIAGVVAFVFMLGIWGILEILQNSLGF